MKLLKNRYVLRLLVLLVMDGLLFSMTDVRNVPSLVVMAGFLLVVLTLYHVFYGLVGLTSLYGLSIKRKKTIALYMTLTAGILIALQSVGELGSRDFWVLLPLVLLSYLYNAYAKTSKRSTGS